MRLLERGLAHSRMSATTQVSRAWAAGACFATVRSARRAATPGSPAPTRPQSGRPARTATVHRRAAGAGATARSAADRGGPAPARPLPAHPADPRCGLCLIAISSPRRATKGALLAVEAGAGTGPGGGLGNPVEIARAGAKLLEGDRHGTPTPMSPSFSASFRLAPPCGRTESRTRPAQPGKELG